jgi:hypothetical protein
MEQTSLSEVFRTEADNTVIESTEVTEEVKADEVDQVETTDEVKSEEVTGEQAAPPADKTEPKAELESKLAQMEAKIKAFQTKALDEVRKRQELERQQAKPDAYAEPDKAIDFSVNQLKSDFDNRFLNLSEYNARSRHSEDFDAMTETFFNEMVQQSPALHQQALTHPDPYEFIYQQAKTYTEFKGVSSVSDLKAKLEAEIRAKVEAEYAEKQKELTEAAIRKAIPQTLATKTAAAGKVDSYNGPTPLSEILKR